MEGSAVHSKVSFPETGNQAFTLHVKPLNPPDIGDLEVWIDVEFAVEVQVDGRPPWIGKVRIGHARARRQIAETLAGLMGTDAGVIEFQLLQAFHQARQEAEAQAQAVQEAEAFLDNIEIEPPEGPALLQTTEELLSRFIVLPEGSSLIISLWIIAAWLYDVFDLFPLLIITSPTKRCGKSNLLTLLREIVPRPCPTLNVSEAALFRTAEAERPTFLLDEGHYLLGAGRTGERVEAIRQLLCGGFRRDDPPVRRLEKVGDGFKDVAFSVFCPKVVALIGPVDDQLADRAIIVRMERKAPTDRVERFLTRRVVEAAEPVRRAIFAWTQAYRDAVQEAYEAVEPIEGIDDREADKFLVLQAVLAVMDPSRTPELIAYARQNAGAAEKQDADAALLAAVRRAFDDAGKLQPDDFLATTALLQALAEDFPWAAVRQDDHAGIVRASRTLSNVLARYGVHSRKVWAGGKTIRGYYRRDLEGVWRKYSPVTPDDSPDSPDSPGFSTDEASDMASQTPLASPDELESPGDTPGPGDFLGWEGPGDSRKQGHARPEGHAMQELASQADPGESGVSGVSTGGLTQNHPTPKGSIFVPSDSGGTSVPQVPLIASQRQSAVPPVEVLSTGPDLEVRVVRDPAGLEDLAQDFGDAKAVVLDTETTGLNWRMDRLRVVSLTIPGSSRVWVVDTHAVDPRLLASVLKGRIVVGHNLKFDLLALRQAGVAVEPTGYVDTFLAEKLLTAGTEDWHACGLAEAVARRLGVRLDKSLQTSFRWPGPLTEAQVRYAALDAWAAGMLAKAQKEALKRDGLIPVARLEFNCLPAIVWLESSGVPFDADRWTALAQEAEAEVERLARQVWEMARINPASPRQVLEALRRRGHAIEDTTEATLKALDDDLARLVLAYRDAANRASKFGRDFLQYVVDGRVYSDWHQIGAVTGRMSSSEPNLQNVPRYPDYPHRTCFKAPEGRVLVKADYSQIELRIAAAIAPDRRMLEAYRQGQDLHTLTAQMVLGKAEVTKEDRQRAKAVNFGLIYGMGAETLIEHARNNYGVELSETEAQEFRRRFFWTYRGIADWHERERQAGPHDVRTRSGRLVRNVDRFTNRLNTPVQGTGADGLKRAMALMYERRHEVPSDVKFCLAVHDEVVVECNETDAQAVADWLKACMKEGMQDLIPEVPVEVEISVGPSWAGDSMRPVHDIVGQGDRSAYPPAQKPPQNGPQREQSEPNGQPFDDSNPLGPIEPDDGEFEWQLPGLSSLERPDGRDRDPWSRLL